ncbi:MAG TPA: class I SAM-dependent methyltransferase, partial [Candidatus Acidoferrum sp.]|nr:class I SAM-dependent methyltransferase [Candidatus Acidoferrum sp.]
ITAQDRVLDLGCGIGNILIALAERVEFSHRPVGVDVSSDLIRIGEREIAQAGLRDRIQLQVSPATRLPFEDGSFDVVLTSHVLKHLDDEALLASFREVARILRPGGRFLLWEFEKSARSAILFWSARLTGLPPPFQLRTNDEFARALRSTGFNPVVRVDTGFFLVPPVPRIALLATR